jgi:uncharacterized repeat protein (TIGR02543 family)
MNYRSSRNGAYSIIGVVLIGFGLLTTTAVPAYAQDFPAIDIWYGHYQRFGHIGDPQPWANILGNVSDSNGIDSLFYSLNGGPLVALSIGPDGYRLESPGDFNIDLATADLVEGLNEVIITAVDNDSPSYQTVDTVTVEYTSGNVWPLPYSVDWDTVTAIGNVAQVVDGLWELTDSTLRTTIPGYDRLIALGDMAWDDYEVTIPVTIHARSPDFGAGVLLRWNGHTDSPFLTDQPKAGYWPLGMICWIQYGRIQMLGNLAGFIETKVRPVSLNVTYMLKARVETVPGVGGYYSLKVWEEGEPEPSEWDITAQEELSDPQSGSMMLISHRADVSFGDVTITPLSLSISDINVDAGQSEATIEWTTNEPATSSVAYGLTAGYELGTESDTALVTNHSIILTGLTPDTLYHYQITSVNASSDSASSGDETFSTDPPVDLSGIVSDDFSSATLNTDVWTPVDPLGDGTMTLTGSGTEDAWANLSVPAGVGHQVDTSGIQALHLLQSANDEDFEIEVKYESPVSQQYQQQGVVIKQDDESYLHFEFYSTTSSTFFFARGFEPGSMPTYLSKSIGSNAIAPLYMRVKREDDQWTPSYSFDGENWTIESSFTHVMMVDSLGPYSGNGDGASSPAHTTSVDYFFNLASPIAPEDSTYYILTANAVGSGLVVKSPDQPTYVYGDTVVVTAVPDTGWVFASWLGALTGTENPDTLVMASDTTVTATFTQEEYALTTNIVGSGSVTKSPDQPTYVYGDTVIVAAIPDTGWVFDGWSDGLTGTENPDTLVVASDTTVTATFTQEEYALTTNIVGSGSITKTPDQPTYVYGDTVIVAAIPDTGWVFNGWSDGLTGTENPDTLVMASDTTVTATFTQEEYALTTNIVGSGSVTKSPDQPTYVYGDTVIVTAIPDQGWVFDSWSDGLTGTENPDTLVMASDTTVTATFTQEEYALTTNTVGSGSVTKSPDQPTYVYGDTVVVTAVPDTGWVFDGWSDGLTGTENPDTLVMVGDTTVTATFTQEEYALTTNIVGSGSVTKSPDQPTYVYGDTVVITAIPDQGWIFDSWSVGLTGTENPDTLVMASDTAVTATFTQGPYTLTIDVVGNGTVTPSPDQPLYDFGDSVTVAAVPDSGWVFDGWADGLTGTENPELLVMVSDTTITAIFTRIQYTLTTKVNFNGSVIRSPDQPTYDYGDTVIVTAVPDTGWVFDSWSDGILGTENPDTLVMVSDTTITATFSEIIAGIEEIVPTKFTLFQNTPNPFNPTTVIRFDLPRSAHVKLFVYNVKGELVAMIIDRDMTEGRKEVTWTAMNENGNAVASGIYFYRLIAGDFVQTKKMVLIR